MFTDQLFTTPSESGGQLVINAAELDGGVHWDPGLRRPYRDDRGQIWYDVTVGREAKVNKDGSPVLNSQGMQVYGRKIVSITHQEAMRRGLPVMNVNNATTLRKDQWIMLDQAVLPAVRQRLRAYADLRAANTYGGFDGMATPILEYEFVTDPGQARASMDALDEGMNFAPSFQLQGLPLPITHCDFWIGERFLAASRSKGQPADTLRGEMAGRRVGELIEQTLIGSQTGVTYGNPVYSYANTSQVYGYTNHPDRVTQSITALGSFTPETFYNDVIAMREKAYVNNFFGPFILYVSTTFDAKLDQVFKTNTGNYPLIGSVRQAVKGIDGITDVRRLDYLTSDTLLLVQMTADVVRAVNGLEVSTVQWDSKGGLQHNFKVMCIQVPQIRSVYKSGTTTRVTGIVHGS